MASLKRVGATAPALIFVLSEKIESYHGNCYSVQDYSAAIENLPKKSDGWQRNLSMNEPGLSLPQLIAIYNDDGY
ncbi:MAG: hypothetical protein MJ181_07200 [Treponema sp.]|nr:hypothetical protein [Treponema sp.]